MRDPSVPLAELYVSKETHSAGHATTLISLMDGLWLIGMQIQNVGDTFNWPS